VALMHYPALERIARGRPRLVGIGSVDLTNLPDAQAAITNITNQMQDEGLGPNDIAFAVAQFGDALNGAASAGVTDPTEAIQAAQSLVTVGHTISGTIQHVQGLLSAAQGGNPAQVYQIFTGSMLSLAATIAGVSMPGVGAAIVGGIGIALNLLQQAGLFGGGAPVGYSLPGCSSNITTSDQATLQVGCVGMYGAGSAANGGAYKQGSPLWRAFPKPSGGNKNDSAWYVTPTQIIKGQYDTSQIGVTGGAFGWAPQVGSFMWSGNPSGTPYLWQSGAGGYRFIDIAFPDWHYLACQSVISGLADFQTAFSAAWVANKEYELNGIKSQPDYVVLDNMIRVWNRAHSASSYVDVAYAPKGNLGVPYYDRYTGISSWACPSGLPPLFQTAIQDLLGNSSPQTASYIVGAKIRINTGPLVTVRRHIDLHLGPTPSTTTAGSVWSNVQALPVGAKVALAVGGAAAATAAGGSLYALSTGQSVPAFWNGVWQGTQRVGKNAVSSALGVVDQVGAIFSAGKRRK
jgi:hypothetical protein